MRKKLKWNRFCTIFVLLMFITVTYASFNTNLFINGKGYVRVDKDIRITNIRLLEVENNGYENVNSEYSVDSVSMDVSLPKQASSVTYEATISNVSDKRYKITDILESSYNNKNVKYELVDASIGNIVEPHTTKTFKVKFTNNVTVVEEDDVYQTLTYTFDYTGDVQEFVVPYDGVYTIELWGAEGGHGFYGEQKDPGKGAYTKGTISLKKNKKLYIYVGEQGKTPDGVYAVSGSFNGGGKGAVATDNDDASGAGGGATDVRLLKKEWNDFQSLKTRIMVAGGGGGGHTVQGNGDNYLEGMNAGGLKVSGSLLTWRGGVWTPIVTQTNGYKFGVGQDGYPSGHAACGGGSGYFGGTNYNYKVDDDYRVYFSGRAAGGSSYISGHNGCVSIDSSSTEDNITFIKGSNNATCTDGTTDISCSYHKSGYKFTNTKMVDGAGYEWTTERMSVANGMPTHDGTSTMTGNSGNGFAKITITRKIEDGSEFDFDYTGGEQTFTVPYSGVYKLETWGAQGGSDRSGTSGGYGGYSTGQIELIKNTNLYLYNGGKGNDAGAADTNSLGGYNGGGNASSKSAADTSNWGAGGGASHIAFEQGLLSTYSDTSKLSNLLIVAGAGGGAGHYGNNSNNGGSGGGYIGSSGMGVGFGTGGTQVSGGIGDTKEKPTDDGKIGLGGNFDKTEWGAGGGSGFYGGGVGYRHGGSAGGGSGYIANENLKNKIMYCYNCEESKEESTKTVATQAHSEMPKQFQAKEGNGYSRITLIKRTINQTKLTLDFTFKEYLNGNEYTFSYTGEPQTFTVPKTGYYKVELWGASGENKRNDYVQSNPTYGGYTEGKIKLTKGEKLYVYVGGVKQSFNCAKQIGLYVASGGATDIRLKTSENWYDLGSLSSRIIVAAGAGGTYSDSSGGIGGIAGGLNSYSSYHNLYPVNATTQTSGGAGTYFDGAGQYNEYRGYDGAFGIGADDTRADYSSGAGGYYGGGSGPSGGGGSSFISGHNGCVAITAESDTTPRNDSSGNQCVDGTTDITCSYHYSNYKFTDTKMIDGKGYQWTTKVGTEVVGMPTHDGTSTMTGNDGDGFAKITLLEEIPEYVFDYTGDVQTFTAPYNGIYKVQLWGASGGSGSADEQNYVYPGGNGAYTSGKINLSKNQKLYLYVGKEGAKHAWDSEELSPPSFNGGGAGGFDVATNNTSDGGGSGGGATDIRLINGNWNNFDSLKSRIMVSAGGGGGAWKSSDIKRGQNGSGLYVKGFGIQSSYYARVVSDGTQFSGYKFGIGKDGESSSSGSSIAGDGGGYWTGVYDSLTKTGIGGTSYISGHQGCVSIAGSSTETNISFVNDSNGVMCNSSESTGYNESGYNTDTSCSKHYSEMEFFDTVMIDGAGYQWTSNGSGDQIVKIPSHDGRTEMIGNTGNGYAKISLVEKVDTYKINYDLDGGTIKNAKKSYSTFDGDITLGTPTKVGYTFIGWLGGKNLLDLTKFERGYYSYNSGNVKQFVAPNSSDGYSTSRVSMMTTLKAGTYTFSFPSAISLRVDDFTGDVYTRNLVAWTDTTEVKTLTLNSDTLVTITFGRRKSEADLLLTDFQNFDILMEEGSEKTDYEPYISTATKNLVIPKGSNGNRTYAAFWRDDSVLCRKATSLHVKPCNSEQSSNKHCTASGYAIGDNITYGTIPTGSDYVAGDAFDCDVNGDGIFNSSSERFYYIADLENNPDYGVLIYQSYVLNGERNISNSSTIMYDSSGENWHGPITAYTDLPSTSQWKTVRLLNSKRQIKSDQNSTTTSGGNLPIFDYQDKAARLATYNEIINACGNDNSNIYERCEYLLEDTSYDFSFNGWGFWLETPAGDSSGNVYYVDTHWRSISRGYIVTNTAFRVKPVIEVPKAKIK